MLNISYNYDKKFDILYARLPFSGHSYGEESNNGIVTFHNIQTDAVTGVAIYDFKKRLERGGIPITPIPIDITSKKLKSLIYS